MKAILRLLISCLLLQSIIHAAPADLDTLNASIVGTAVNAAVTQPDGKTILIGNFTQVLGQNRNHIARLNADGTLDAGFNPNAGSEVRCLAVLPNGKILIGGNFTTISGVSRVRIAQLTEGGVLDTANFTPPAPNGIVNAIMPQTDGKILIGGNFTNVSGSSRLARLNENGFVDTAFVPGISAEVRSILIQQGNILFSGLVTGRIDRVFTATGAQDTTFTGSSSASSLDAIALQADGKILIAGNGGGYLRRLESNGAVDATFTPTLNGRVYGISVQASGKIIVSGAFTLPKPNLLRLNGNGTTDTTFDPRPNKAAFGVSHQSDGKILVTGDFESLQPSGGSTINRNGLARLANDGVSQGLGKTSSSRVFWSRSGSAPEVTNVTFELSSDGGVSYTFLGNGTRIGTTASWELAGLALPASGKLRARGRTSGGLFNAGVGFIEQISSSSDQPASDFIYSVNGSSATITGYAGSGGAVVIPATVGWMPVTAIGSNCFSGESTVTAITIPYGVTTIGSSAFSDCAGLISVNIPSGVTSIGNNAFMLCSNLTSISIPASVTSIGSNAFSYCGGLTSLTISSGVTSIGASAFTSCSSLTTVIIPASVTRIEYDAFGNCAGLTSVTISNGVTSIGDWAFAYCTSLASLTIPASVEDIGGYAFYNCDGLTSLTISNGVTSLGNSAFSDCSKLTALTIPASVVSIGRGAFSACILLTGVTVDAGNTAFSSVAGVLFNKTQTVLIQYPGGKSGAYTIPSSVTEVGNSAFYYCYKLTSVVIPSGVVSVGEGAFQACYGMTSLTLANGVISIGASAFSSCSGLTTVTIPASVTSIGSQAFLNCSGLTGFTVDAGSTAFSSASGVLFNETKTLLIQYPGKKSGAYTIPVSVTSIGNYAFYYCGGLTGVSIPFGVTSIGDYAFYYCSGLTSVIIPASTIRVGSTAFFGCSTLTSVTISNGVMSIGDSAFSYCSKLSSVAIPASVTSIGSNVFYRCTVLVGITVDPANTTYSSLDGVLFNKTQTLLIQYPTGKSGAYIVPSTVTRIGSYAFYYNISLTSVTIPSTVMIIEGSAFQYCAALTSVTISNGVATIGNNAFAFCTSLTSITFPLSVTNINYSAFGNCANLASATFSGNAPTMNSDVFRNAAFNFTFYYYSGNTGFTSPTWKGYPSVQLTNPTAPEIVVEIPADTNFNDGNTLDFAAVNAGSTKSFTVVVRNTGTGLLNGLSLTKGGTDAARFSNTALPVTTLLPGGSSSFSITFAPPAAAGVRTSVISIASNDANENPFEINLSGSLNVVLPPPQPTLEATNREIDEDGQAALNIHTDTNAPPDIVTTLTVVGIPPTWSVIPNGGTYNLGTGTWNYILSPGTTNYTGGPTIGPPSNSDLDSPELAVTVVNRNPSTGLTTSDTGVIKVIVDAVGDPPDLSAAASQTFDGVGYPLTIATSLKDTDGSETLTKVVVKDIPSGGSLSAGVQTSPGIYELPLAQLSNLRFLPPPGATGTIALRVESHAQETNKSDADFDLSNDVGIAVVSNVAFQIVSQAEIVVELEGTSLVDDGPPIHFGSRLLGQPTNRTLVIRNDGTALLTGLAITGATADFTVGSLGTSSLAAGQSLMVDVTFRPTVSGIRTAALEITRSDAAESPFDLRLEGTGLATVSPVFNAPGDVPYTTNGFTAAGLELGVITLGFAPTPGMQLELANNTAVGEILGMFSGLPEGSILSANFGAATYYFQISYHGGDGNNVVLTAVSVQSQAVTANFDSAAPGPVGNSYTESNLTFTSPTPMSISSVLGAKVLGGTASGTIVVTSSVPGAPLNLTSFEIVSPEANGGYTMTARYQDGSTYTSATFGGGTTDGSFLSELLNGRTGNITSLTFNTEFSSDPLWIDRISANVLTPVSTPVVSVELPNGTPLADGADTVDFGSVPLGNTGSPITLSVRNTGTGDLTGLTASVSGDYEEDFDPGNFADTVLAPGESIDLEVFFTPDAAGPRAAVLHISSNDSSSPFDVMLTGSGASTISPLFNAPGDVIFTSNSFHAGNLNLGAINLGFAPLLGTQLMVVNNTGAGAVTGIFSGLPEGATLNADFEGATYSFQISYVGGDGNDIVLTAMFPQIEIESPVGTLLADGLSTIDFGTALVGNAVKRTFTIRNTGNAELSGLGVTSFSGPGAGQFSWSGLPAPTLAPGQSVTFEVSFLTWATGTRQASLHFASNDADRNPFDIALTGTGIDTLSPVFDTAGNVPWSGTALYAGSLNFGTLTLQFAPAPGTHLRVFDNTGGSPITGTLTNLAEGGMVTATYGGQTYTFTASYTGGDGNDLIFSLVSFTEVVIDFGPVLLPPVIGVRTTYVEKGVTFSTDSPAGLRIAGNSYDQSPSLVVDGEHTLEITAGGGLFSLLGFEIESPETVGQFRLIVTDANGVEHVANSLPPTFVDEFQLNNAFAGNPRYRNILSARITNEFGFGVLVDRVMIRLSGTAVAPPIVASTANFDSAEPGTVGNFYTESNLTFTSPTAMSISSVLGSNALGTISPGTIVVTPSTPDTTLNLTSFDIASPEASGTYSVIAIYKDGSTYESVTFGAGVSDGSFLSFLLNGRTGDITSLAIKSAAGGDPAWINNISANVVTAISPPSIQAVLLPSGEYEITFTGILQSSPNLLPTSWQDITPQPPSPYVIPKASLGNRGFFRATNQ